MNDRLDFLEMELLVVLSPANMAFKTSVNLLRHAFAITLYKMGLRVP